MSKLKLFLENFLVYGFGGVLSKLIPLVMVPIVTAIIPNTGYYAISDLSNTVIQFSCAFAVMGMYDAMYRMFFERDDEEYKRTICSTALVFTLITSIIVFIMLLVFKNYIAVVFFGNKKYAYIVYISAIATLIGATNSIISAPTRMQNKRRVFLITNLVGSLISYSIAIPLLLHGYYVVALPLAGAVSAITMEALFGFLNGKWFKLKLFDMDLLRQMLVIAIPLLPNFVIYWVFNSCDKIMITNLMGIDATGVYSVGSKFGSVSQLIYTAFAGGWQFFAFSTMKEENQVKNNSNIFEYLGIISYIATCFACVSSFWVFKIFFKKDYIEAYIVAPYLFLAPLLQMLFQVAANQFLVTKKTWPNFFILTFGAVLNVLINYFMIPILGIEGAALATLVGYLVSDIICVVVLCKMKLMIISRKFILSTILMFMFVVLWRVTFSDRITVGICSVITMLIISIYLYRRDINKLLCVIKKNDN